MRAHALQTKQDACQRSFESFVKKCSGDQPAALTVIQKFWTRAMLLVDDWKELCQWKEQQLEQLTEEHEQLQNEHQVLNANVQGLKLTVQNMLGDVSALLQHTTSPNPQQVGCEFLQQPQLGISTGIDQKTTTWQLASDHAEEAPMGLGPFESITHANAEQTPAAAALQVQVQEPKSHAVPGQIASRSSAQIVSSLICSIEQMSKRFADCQSSKLMPGADDVSSGCRSGCRTGAHTSGIKQQAPASTQEGCTPVARFSTANTVIRPAVGGSVAGNKISSAKWDCSSQTAPRHHVPGTPAGALASRVHVNVKATVVGGPASGQPDHQLASPSSYPMLNQTADAPGLPAAFIGAQPSRSHPPDSSVAPSPATAQRHTLAWFLQNAGSPCVVSSSMPSKSATTAAEPSGAAMNAAKTASATGSHHEQPADAAARHGGTEVTKASGEAGIAEGVVITRAADAETHTEPVGESVADGNMQATTHGLSRPDHAVTAQQTSNATAAAPENGRQQALSLEPSVSEWAGAQQRPRSTAQIRSGGGRVGPSSTLGKTSCRVFPVGDATHGHPGYDPAPASVNAAPTVAIARSFSRASGRTSSSGSGASLTELVRRQQQHKLNTTSIYQYEVQTAAAPASSTTSSMVAAAAAKLGIQVGQQPMRGLSRVSGTSKVNTAGNTVQIKRSRAASGNSVIAAHAVEGPLTAALNRQGALGRTTAVAPSGRQVVPAGTTAPAHAARRLHHHLRHSAQPMGASGGMQHYKVRPGSAVAALAVQVAAADSSRLADKPYCNSSNSSGHKVQKRQPAAGSTRSKRPQQTSQQHLQPGQVAAGWMSQGVASLGPAQPAATPSTTTQVADGRLDASKQQQPDRPCSSGSSDSEVSDMVLLGSCASPNGWSSQTSPAQDTASYRTHLSPPDATVAEPAAAAAGVSEQLLSQDNNAADAVVRQAAEQLVDLGSGKNIGTNGSAAVSLNLLHTKQGSTVVGASSALGGTHTDEFDAAPRTTTAAIGDPKTANAAAATSWANVDVAEHCPTSTAAEPVDVADCSKHSGFPVSVEPHLTTVQQAAAATAALAAVNRDMGPKLTAPAAGDEGLVELPDAVKELNKADSPRKQPRKMVSTAALEADTWAGDGNSALQRASDGTGHAAVVGTKHAQADHVSSSCAKAGSPGRTREFARSDHCQPSSPVSPLAPLSKRLRSSSDCRSLQQQRQATQQQQVKDIQVRQQVSTPRAADGDIDRLQTLQSQAAAAAVMASVPNKHSVMQCPEAGPGHDCEDRSTTVRATGLRPNALTTAVSIYDSAVAAPPPGETAAWQGETSEAVDTGIAHCPKTGLTVCADKLAAATNSAASSSAVTAEIYPLAAVHGINSRPETQPAPTPAAASVEAQPTIGRDQPHALQCTSDGCDGVSTGCSRSAAGVQSAVCAAEPAHVDTLTSLTSVQCDWWGQQAVESGPGQDPDSCSNNELLQQPTIKCADALLLGSAHVPAGAGCGTAGAGDRGLFNLEELLPIVLDVMHSKKEVDHGCVERHEPIPAPTHYLQQYIMRQVQGDEVLYIEALAKTLASLDCYKDYQPEVAVFCRVLAGEVDEDYFHQHLLLRNQLQLLASDALMQQQQQQQWPDWRSQPGAPCSFSGGSSLRPTGMAREQQQRQQEHQAGRYDVCCHATLSDAQLSWLLGVWGRQRSSVLVRPGRAPGGPQEEELHKIWWMAVNRHCDRMYAARMTACVIEALLLWELQQHVSCLASVAEAFKVADVANRGLLDLQQFQVFCRELNDAMSQSEVEALFVDELDKHGVQLVTFSSICRCLLPAM